MGYKARWGSMGFLVSPTKIVPFDDLSTTIAMKSDSGDGASTNNRGRELQSIQFKTQYLRAAGVDPRKKFDEWSGLVGTSNALYIGEKRFGPSKMTLKSVALSDSVLGIDGSFLSVTLSITLEEYSTETSTKKSTKTSKKKKDAVDTASAKKAAETYAKTVEKKKAMQATASTTERKGKMYTDRRLQ